MTSVEEGSQINTLMGSWNKEIGDVEPCSVLGGSKREHETSFIWSHMERVDVDGVRKSKCNCCGKLLVASQGTGMSSLKRHVEKCLSKHQAATDQTNTLFDPNDDKAKVAKMIIMHELPLRFVEYTGYRKMIEYCEPRYQILHRGFVFSDDLQNERDNEYVRIEQVEESSSFDYSIEVLGGDEEFELYKSQAVSSLNKSEFERYLGEQVETNTSNFDILPWWKVNKGRYSILAKISNDILAIPVSMVASESAFSVGGRFLGLHHRRLNPDTLEALMCAQNWIWAPLRGRIPKEEVYATEGIDDEEPVAPS
ncbi:hypothetical protein Ddye_008115 [Dipteronia dyeriana]|uniref:BED-type domain-containing protein n=1 Tax=Dipteronia dyeriana TaxID=168575 RepID=A0AAE0CLL7_9ROSI|nr:hypothetical protein Ddye_008115 [Dipteronia dyeriana]